MSKVCGNYIEMDLSETQVTLGVISIKFEFGNLGLIATLSSLIIGVDMELRVKHGSCIGKFNFVTKHRVHPSVYIEYETLIWVDSIPRPYHSRNEKCILYNSHVVRR
jgi:hypothetical protein